MISFQDGLLETNEVAIASAIWVAEEILDLRKMETIRFCNIRSRAVFPGPWGIVLSICVSHFVMVTPSVNAGVPSSSALNSSREMCALLLAGEGTSSSGFNGQGYLVL